MQTDDCKACKKQLHNILSAVGNALAYWLWVAVVSARDKIRGISAVACCSLSLRQQTSSRVFHAITYKILEIHIISAINNHIKLPNTELHCALIKLI